MWPLIFPGMLLSLSNMIGFSFCNEFPFSEELLWAGHFLGHATYIMLLDFHENTVGQISLSPFYTCGNWNLVGFSDLPKAILLGREDPRANPSSMRPNSLYPFHALQRLAWPSTLGLFFPIVSQSWQRSYHTCLPSGPENLKEAILVSAFQGDWISLGEPGCPVYHGAVENLETPKTIWFTQSPRGWEWPRASKEAPKGQC